MLFRSYEEEVHDASTSQTKVTKTRRERFCEKSQLWTLLRCVGEESREALSTLGVDLSDENLTYNTVWDKLKEHYERDESEYVKVDKFVSCRQTAGEEDRDYLLRCERLGRRCDFTAMNVRERFTLSIAVRGLRDVMLKRELMAIDRLDWPTLNRILRARTGAQESLNALGDRVETPHSSDVSSRVSSAGGKSAPTESTSVKPVVKQEVSEVRYGSHREYSGDRRSRHSRDSSRDRDWRREGSRNRYGSRDYSRGRYERREYSRERGSRGDRDEGRYDNYRSRQSRRDDSRDRSYRSGRNDSHQRELIILDATVVMIGGLVVMIVGVDMSAIIALIVMLVVSLREVNMGPSLPGHCGVLSILHAGLEMVIKGVTHLRVKIVMLCVLIVTVEVISLGFVPTASVITASGLDITREIVDMKRGVDIV